MVYTVTFNPSLDYIVEVKSFELGMTNRTSYEHMLPGGKGINVSIVLNNLEFDTTAFGFVAGFTGNRYVTWYQSMALIQILFRLIMVFQE